MNQMEQQKLLNTPISELDNEQLEQGIKIIHNQIVEELNVQRTGNRGQVL